MKNEQPPLFDLRHVAVGVPKGKKHYWYYITNATNQRMVYGLSPDGAPLWCEHDIRPEYGVKPYLFNSMSGAKQYMRDRKISGNVKRWLFSYK